MGILHSKSCTYFGISALFFVLSCLLHSQTPKDDKSPSLGEAFNAGAPEVEPVVVGRERWNQKPPTNNSRESAQPASETSEKNEPTPSPRIDELDPLETKQPKQDPELLPLDPPKIKPATSIVRNFEGTLIFKPRKYGFANDFAYQLVNANGKRLAFVDISFVKAVNPQQFKDKKVNIMGKLESLKEGSDELVIRARVIRPSN